MIKFCKVHPLKLDDDRQLYCKDIPFSLASEVHALASGSEIEQIKASAVILLAVLCDKDGNPLPELEGKDAEWLASNTPFEEMSLLMDAVAKSIEVGNS